MHVTVVNGSNLATDGRIYVLCADLEGGITQGFTP
jgi:hypothetical protein